MEDVTRAPLLYLSFVAWHVFAGFAGTSLVYRARFGTFPNVVLRRSRRAPRHRRIQIGMAVASLAWFAAVGGYALWPESWSHALGRPLVGIAPEVGWLIAGVGHVGMVTAQLAMGRALRVGLVEEGPAAPSELVSTGLFRWSRHPVYVFSVLFLVGEWIWNPTALAAACVLALAAGFDALAREEERVLEARFGDRYVRYRERSRRYL